MGRFTMQQYPRQRKARRVKSSKTKSSKAHGFEGLNRISISNPVALETLSLWLDLRDAK
jgi:hypothetical protein